MKLVIDISKGTYLLAKKIVKTSKKHNAITRAIANGTPIPKGCRLIDADALGEKLHRYTEAPYQYALTVFNESPTIIEADKESEDGSI